MPITVSDLILYGSTGRPGSDTGTVGGGIDLTARPITSPMSSAAAVEMISSSSGDNRTATVAYRTTGGTVETWSPTLAGSCAILLSTGTPEYLLTAVLSSASTSATAQIRVSSGPTIHVFNPGEVSAFQLFNYAAAASSEVKRYEKLFLKNVSTESDLSSALVAITSDASTQYRIGLSATKDSTDGWANRLTDPGYTWVDSSYGVSVPSSTLGLGEAIGIGVEQTLAANATQGHPSILIEASGGTVVST
jgi:hypothetical protein